MKIRLEWLTIFSLETLGFLFLQLPLEFQKITSRFCSTLHLGISSFVHFMV